MGAQWLFPIGAALTIVGVIFELLLLWERPASRIPSDLVYVMGVTMSLSLLVGPLLLIAGSIADRIRLPVAKTKPRGNLCLIIAISCFVLTITHHFGFDDPFILLAPTACAGLIGGSVLYTKRNKRSLP